MSAIEEMVAERDKMLARASRGAARDDGYTPERWIISLQSILDGGYGQRGGFGQRHLWIKIGALALRAVEAIDRRREAS